MAQRNFSSPLRISAIADITLILLVIHAAGILSQHFSANAARNTISNKPIDDGGIKVPSSLSGKERKIIAVRNQPLTLRCPIVVTDDVRILDLWWMKDEVKLDLYPTISATTTNSGQQQTNSQQQHQSQLQTSTQAQYNPPSSAASTSTSSVVPSSAPRVLITNEGDLHFEKINHKVINSGQRHKNYSDEGDYRCVFKTPLGVVLSPVITVSVASPIDTRPTEEVKAKSGEPILLECQIASPSNYHSLSSSDLQFTWIRSDNVSITQEIDVRYNILSSGTLAISNVSRRDAGEFRCIVKDKSSNSERVSYVNLVVLPGNDNVSSEPPKIISTKSFDGSKTVLILDEEENAILDCIASGIPKPVINWIVTTMNENGTISLQVSHGSPFRNSINISSELARGTEGNFSCIADNGIGEAVTRTLQVFRLPALQAEPQSYQYPAAKTVRFECKVPPLFSLVWYKDGQLLETGKGRVKVKENELVVSNTIRNDSGFYQCEVIADDRVYAIGTARLLVNNNREAPDAPTNVGCLERHPTALTVSWTPPVKFEDIISFTIHYMPTRGEERQRVVPPRTTSVTVGNLQPHTDYSIYIRSYSTKSASAQSIPVICKTREDVPVDKLPHVEQEHYGPSSQVRLTWRPLSNKDARGKIILYKLQWRSVNGEFSNVRYIDGDSKEFIITDLSADQEYEYRLIPSTSVGWPARKETWTWMPISVGDFDANLNSTNEDYFVPPSLHLTVLNSTSVLVNWSEPPRPKEVHMKGFRITYSTKSDRVDDVVFFGPITLYDVWAREYLFTNLAPGSNYEFYLQTWGEDWESGLASKFIGTFPDSEGGQIDNLPVVTGIQVHPISTRESVEIKGLDPYTSYEFVVQLTLKDGRVGPYSQKIESRTLSGTPGAPVALHWRVHNQSVIEVEWTPPVSPNGIITKYWIEFRLNKTENPQNGTSSSGASAPKREWSSKSTSNTSIFLNDLQRNEGYVVRVKAETKAGVGEPSEIVFVKIFNRKPAEQPPSGDQPKPDTSTLKPNDQQRLGIVIGIALSAVFIEFLSSSNMLSDIFWGQLIREYI